MLYARELIGLMGAYPGRDWRMVEIVRYVGGADICVQKKRAVRKSVMRAIEALRDAGVVIVRPPSVARGGYATYRWINREK